jgi:nucleoside-diphosphate-sugar epimerase
MQVLITGGAGYVGSVLAGTLIDQGHKVRVLDVGFFGLDHVDPRAELVVGSILNFEPEWLEGVEAVVHLAGLSNDPMAAFSPSLNYMLNASGTAIVAQASKEAGVRRFVFSSTCSVYGMDESGPLDEEHPIAPRFPYAISKVMAERMLTCLTDESFRPIMLRKGTVVGWSPRMRYDLVTNSMVKSALTRNKIVIHNPNLWRPLIDVEDACEAYACALAAPMEVTGVFNISSRNYTLAELGVVVAQSMTKFGVDPVIETEYREDVRSYRVSTEKASRVLKFHAKKSMSDTVSDVMTRVIDQPIEEFEHPKYYNIRQMQLLMADGRLHQNGHTTAPIKASAQEAIPV